MTDEKGHITPYYNGMERIASRLGDQNLPINVNDPELQDRKDWQDSLIRRNVTEITGYDFLPIGEEQNPEDPKPVFELPQVGITSLQPISSGSVYYYHPNHLGSTCYVTDGNASVVQGFLYAPFGEITNEHNSSFGSSVLPKYSFNAKELDEETGMYYYEARYYQPPVFISRDPLFEKYPTFSPYTYCANNPVKYVDPDGRDTLFFSHNGYFEKKLPGGDNIGMIRGRNGEYATKFEFADERWCDRFVACSDDDEMIEKNLGREKDELFYNKIIYANDKMIESILGGIDYTAVQSQSLSDRIKYAMEQSRGIDKTLDFVNHPEVQSINPYALILTSSRGEFMAHDKSNFGNFLWGMAMRRLKIPALLVWLGSNWDCYKTIGEFDSTDDQRSIWFGYFKGKK